MRTDFKQQSKMESYGGSPMPLEGQRGLSEVMFVFCELQGFMALISNK